jgi:chromosome partitioning protein
MKVIGITGQKGGSGKTTLAVNLAAWYTNHGFQTAVLDRDPQGAVERWNKRGNGLSFKVYADLKAQLGAVLEARDKAGDDLAIIDTAPSIGGAFREVPHYSDVIVLPSTPSGPDVEALNTSFEILTGEFHHKQVGAVLTQVFKNYNITRDAIAALETLGIPLFAQIGHRTGYQITGTDGNTVFGGGYTQAEEEIAELAESLLSMINMKPPAKARR